MMTTNADTLPDAPPTPLRRVLALAWPERRSIGIGTLFLVISAAMSLAYPQAIRVIIDSAFEDGDPDLVDTAALAMLVIFFIQGISTALRSYLFTVAGERIVTRLRSDLFSAILHQEVGFFDARRTGELTNRLASDTTVLQNTVSVNVSMAMRHTASVIGGIALLLYTSPQLTLLMLAVVPAVALGAVFVGRRIRVLSRQAQDALAAANEVAEETISGLRTVRVFTREHGEAQRYSNKVEQAFELARKRAAAGAAFFGTASFAGYAAVALVLWYGGHLVIDQVMSVGDLTSFVLYTLLVAFALGALGSLWTDFMKATGSAERVFALLDRVPAIPLTGGSTLPAIEGRIDFEHVSFTYPTRPDITVLNTIDLHIEPGEAVALVGPSGSGKSTVASLLTRLYDPDSGSILIDKTPLTELDPLWLRQQIGVVSQEPILFSTTIADNIRYGRESATREDIEAAARAANAHDFIETFPEGYDTLVGERGVQLSGGQKQRVAIARAVLKDPSLLILDEATSALDAESEHLVKEALDRLMQGRSTLIIAHRLSTVKDADRVLVLEGGRIIQSGSHKALLEQEGLYKQLIERQFVAA